MKLFRLLASEVRAPKRDRPPAIRFPARPRDSQRARLYAAERTAFMRDSACPHAAFGWLPRLEQVRAFVTAVATHPRVTARYPHAVAPGLSILDGLEVRDGRGRRSAAAYLKMHAIAVPTALRMRWVVLHELSHVVTRGVEGDNVAAHGPEFAGHYLVLVQLVFGDAAADRLHAAFRDHRVSVTRLERRV